MTPLQVFWRHKGFWLAQAFAFAVLAAIAVSWFWLPDSKAWAIALTAVQACVVIIGLLWLIATTFVFYRSAHAENDLRLPAAYREGLRRSPRLLAWAALTGVALWLVPRWAWLVAPFLLLPVAAWIMSKSAGNIRRPGSVVQFTLLAAVGGFVPMLLIAWHPGLPGVALQTASLVVRLVLAYLLVITSWLMMASLLSAPGVNARR